MGEWKPIESAPKDGTRVLLWLKGNGNEHVIGRWKPQYEGDAFPWYGDAGYESFKENLVTHWQPLPAPPSQEGSE
jgi:hypothetical protein